MPHRRAVAPILAMLLAGCSSAPPVSNAPVTAAAPPIESAAPLPLSTGATAAPSGLPSVAPSIGGSPSPSDAPVGTPAPAGSDGWTAMLPPVQKPGAYLDFGFAGNGDVITVGTDDLQQRPATIWIERFSPDGTKLGEAQVARKMTAFFGSDYVEVDPSNDSVLFTQVDFSTGLYHVDRVDSSTGKQLERLDLHPAMNAITVTPDGRVFGITATYGGWNYKHPCIVDRVGAGGGIASGVDYDLVKCETLGHFTEPFSFQDPEAIDVGIDGNLLVLDWGEKGKRLHDEPAGLGMAVLTPGFDFVRRWHLPASFQTDNKLFGIPAQGWFLSASADGLVFIDRLDTAPDLSKSLGHRLGVFSRGGDLLATFGHDGDHPGLTDPIAARPDASGRVWVIDFDAAANGWVLKRSDNPLP